MKKRHQLRSIASLVALVTAVLLPSLSLVPLGGIWLWQQGFLLHWAVGVALAVGAIYAVERSFLRSLAEPRAVEGVAAAGAPGPGWTPAETSAWQAVQEVAAGIDAGQLDSRDAVLELGRTTIEAVARRLHPEVAEPIWQFTVPEALAIAERVSRQLGNFVETSLPLSDRLTVAQVLALYRWRGTIGVAERAYDVWRLIRLANPMTAATQELRERLARQMLAWGQTHVTERLARAYVEEVGRAAIDLYGGRLRTRRDTEAPPAARPEQTIAEQTEAEPIRILLGGRTQRAIADVARHLGVQDSAAIKSGRSQPLTFAGDPVALDSAPSLHLRIASLPAEGSKAQVRIAREAVESDLILWALDGTSGELDRSILDAIRYTFIALRHRRSPPLLVVVTEGEGSGSAVESADTASVIGVDPSALVALSKGTSDATDADLLWARVTSLIPDARHARATRMTAAPRRWRDWGRTFNQAFNAGRTIARTLGRR